MFCTNCGASNKNGGDLCVNCGESLRNNQIEDRLSRLRALNDAPSSSKFDFLHSLFDFSFHRPVTMKTMKLFYILSMLFAGLMALFLVLVGFETSIWYGIFALLVGVPVVFLFTVVFTRVFLEMSLVVFRVANEAADSGIAIKIKGRPSTKEKGEPKEGIQWNV
jgi:hypothetical protein